MLPRCLAAALACGLSLPAARAIDDYKPGPDSMPQEGVP